MPQRPKVPENFMTDKNTTSPAATDASTTTTAVSPMQQMLIDYGPLIIFFAAYKFYDIYIATGVFMLAILVGVAVSRVLTGHISGMLKFTFAIVMVMGGLTLYLQDDTFLKMKPTIVYGIFVFILGVSMMRGKLILKNMLGKTIDVAIDDAVWRTLTKQAMAFFAVMMLANEVIWRTQSTDTWVSFKVFGFTGASIVFTFWIVFQLMRFLPPEDTPETDE